MGWLRRWPASEAGANVWAAGRTEANLKKAREVANGRFKVVQANTHDQGDLETIFKEVGTIDHLVSAAIGGERTLKPFLEQTEGPIQGSLRQTVGLRHL